MRTIHKFDLDAGPFGVTQLSLSRRSSIVAIGMQGGKPRAWAMLDTEDADRVVVTVTIVPTGAEMPDDLGFHQATFLENDGEYVWHAFVWYGEAEVSGVLQAEGKKPVAYTGLA